MESIEKYNIAYFLNELENLIIRQKIKQPIFRGQVDSFENKALKPIMSTAARRLKRIQNKDLLTQSRFIQYHKDIIEKSRVNGYDKDENNIRTLSDLEVLAQIQHYGGATCLVDFTKNFLTALWFATEDRPKKQHEEHKVSNDDIDEKLDNGRIYILDLYQKTNYLGFITPDIFHHKSIEQILKFEITGEEYKDIPECRQKFWIWTPDRINNRIFSQDSIFVFGLSKFENILDKPKLYYEIEIPKDAKKTIRKELEFFFNITAETIYSDLPGFSGEANRSDKKVRILENAEPCMDVFELLYIKKDYNQADSYLNQALMCCKNKICDCPLQIDECFKRTDNEHLSNIYYWKAKCCYESDKFNQLKALSFYYEALRINPTNEDIFEELEWIYYDMKDYKNALKYADKIRDKKKLFYFISLNYHCF